jgi:fatty-acyl-CoA synthase
MAGSTCPQEVVIEASNKLNISNIVVVYGMTETSPVVSMSSINDSSELRTATIGKPLEHLECKVVDENYRVVQYNQPGQLLVRGYSTLIEYWNDKDKTTDTYTYDRFLKTG